MRAGFYSSALVIVLFATTGLLGCEKIYTGEQLAPRTIKRLQQLRLLNPQEKVYQFYTNAPNKAAGAGSFYTTERIASYWLDKDKRKTQIHFAYYKDIARIDTIYLDKALTYVSYMTVLKRDGSRFQVYVGGKKPIVSAFFEHAMAHWQAAACITQ
jgi:hypothetical protein